MIYKKSHIKKYVHTSNIPQKRKIKIRVKKIPVIISGIILLLFLGVLLNKHFLRRAEIIYPHAKIIAAKTTFKSNEKIVFKLKLGPEGLVQNTFVEKARAYEEPKIETYLTVSDQKQLLEPKLKKTGPDEYSMSIDASKQFRPGTYTLHTSIKNDFGVRKLTQDFSWGVLAINTNKSVFQQNDTVKFSMSVLNEGGFNTCNAILTLTITVPNGDKKTLTTERGDIVVSDACWGSNVTYEPDYSTTYKVTTEGTYLMQLEAVTKNGHYTIEDTFETDNSAMLDVERIGPTRINPVAPYTMKIKVKAKKDFSGTIVETLPYVFSGQNTSKGELIHSPKGEYYLKMKWDRTLKKNEETILSYTFNAPDISPEFYLIDPLQFLEEDEIVFQEARYWQISADPTKLILLWDDNASTPSGWTCVSCSTGDTFFQKFIRGAAAYSAGGGGSDTHTPGVASDSAQATTAERGTSSQTSGSAGTGHGHNASPTTVGSGSSIPPYRSLRVISYDAGIPTGASAIPSGAIALFDTTVPTGWTRYSAQDGNFARGDWTVTTGGSSSHTHTLTWGSLLDGYGSTVVTGNTGNRAAPIGHTHGAPATGDNTVAADCNNNNCLPPFINTILGKANSSTSMPIGMIGMFDGAAGTGWSDVSQSAQAFNNKFFYPTSTYGSTGGGESHLHNTATSAATLGPSTTANGSSSGTGAASEAHTHTIRTTFNSSSNLPAYVDVIMAKRQVAITGTVKQSDESSAIGNPPCDGSTAVISARVNGGSPVTAVCQVSDSTFGITVDAAAGQIITLYLTSTAKANAVIVVGSSSEITGVDLYQDEVVVRDEGSGGVTSANMGQYDNDNNATDMLFTVDGSNNLSVESNIELHIWTGDTFSPSGTVTTQGTGNLHLDDSSSATLGSATNAIGNDIVIDTSATLTVNASTTVAGGDITATGTLTTSAGTPTITMRGTGSISGAGTKTVYNLAVGDGTTATTTLSGALTANNDVTVGTGSTFNANATLNISGGDFTTTTTGIVNTTSGTPTVTITGTGNVGPGAGGSFAVYNLVIDGTQTLIGAITANNDITVNTGDSLALASQNVTISGGDFTTAGTGTVTCAGCSAGTVDISGTGNIGGGGTVTVYNLTINGTQTLASALVTGGDVTVAAGDTLALGSQNVTVNGGDLTTTTTGAVTCSACSAGTVTLTASGNLGAGGGWKHNGLQPRNFWNRYDNTYVCNHCQQ